MKVKITANDRELNTEVPDKTLKAYVDRILKEGVYFDNIWLAPTAITKVEEIK